MGGITVLKNANKIIIGSLLIGLITNFYNCTPRLIHFPKQIDSAQFEQYAKIYLTPSKKMWELESSKDYYFETDEYTDEENLIKMIKKALKSEGYRIVTKKGFENCIIGKRNFFSFNNDKTRVICCVYYQSMTTKLRSQVFIKYKINKKNSNTVISFHITGKYILNLNRAKIIGEQIKANLSRTDWKIHF